MKTLVTGPNGNVGVAQVSDLLGRGPSHQVVCLVRGESDEQAYSRMTALVDDPGDGRLTVVRGDITLPDAGISRKDWAYVAECETVLHIAGCTKFGGRHKEIIWQTNLLGTQNMLAVAQKIEARFVYVSTAFVLGHGAPHNDYEASKTQAERAVEEAWIPHTILRLPVVIGHSITGEIFAFDGYYRWFMGLWLLKCQLREIWKASQSQAIEAGFRFEGDILILDQSLWLSYQPDAPLSLMPVDCLAEAITRVLEEGGGDRVLNLTHPQPPTVGWVVKISLEILGIKGVKCCERGTPSVPSSSTLRRAQEAIDREQKAFAPYVMKSRCFPCDMTGDTPEITAEMLGRMLAYACRREFGGIEMAAVANA